MWAGETEFKAKLILFCQQLLLEREKKASKFSFFLYFNFQSQSSRNKEKECVCVCVRETAKITTLTKIKTVTAERANKQIINKPHNVRISYFCWDGADGK